jgi:hypothetical protein
MAKANTAVKRTGSIRSVTPPRNAIWQGSNILPDGVAYMLSVVVIRRVLLVVFVCALGDDVVC